jgi:hypothetical protein
MVQLIARKADGQKTVINTTNDYEFLTKIIIARDGYAWIGDELCELVIEIIR